MINGRELSDQWISRISILDKFKEKGIKASLSVSISERIYLIERENYEGYIPFGFCLDEKQAINLVERLKQEPYFIRAVITEIPSLNLINFE